MASATYGTYRETDIADRFLSQIGAPHTPDMQRAVIAWMRFESGKGSITANNPWNLTGSLWDKIVGYWRGGSATEQHDFPIFSDVYGGVDAAAQNLSTNAYGYPTAVARARSGDSAGFLQALAQSQWCTCHYPSWQSREGAAASIAAIQPGNVTSHAPGATLAASTQATLAASEQDIAALGVFDQYVGKATWNQAIAQIPVDQLRNITQKAVDALGLGDKTVSKSDYAKIADKLHEQNVNPLDVAGTIAGFLGKLVDPQNWARALAIAGGAG